MTEIVEKNGIEYTKSNNRMRYHAEFHDKHGQPWTLKEIAYLCGMWGGTKKRDISLALGRTEGTCMNKVCKLKRVVNLINIKRCLKKSKKRDGISHQK